MADYGLVGKSLSHSFSKNYFEKKFAAEGLQGNRYHNFELPDLAALPGLIRSMPDLKGLNVTIPYKEQVIPFLDEIDREAEETGAVNCISIRNGKLRGYNTDIYGFAQSIKPFLDTNHERALVLGTGGAAKAVAHVLRKIGVQVHFVTSSPAKKNNTTFLYEEITPRVMQMFRMVVNTTPLGMYPNVDAAPDLPYEEFTEMHLACDLIYNPPQTLFLKRAAAQGAMTVNGQSMLELQAEKSWEIWNSA